MAVDPQIVAAEVKFRTAILGGDANARKAVLKAYTGAFKAVSADLQAVTSKINAARLAGDDVSAAWLMQQQRYRDLQAQTAKMVDSMASALGTALPEDQKQAAKAAELLVGQASGPIFNKLPATAVEGVIGTTASGSPLRTLFDSFNIGATQDASRFIRSRLIAGITLGRPAATIAKEISNGVSNLTLARAMTISRTESQRALRRATALSIQNNLDLIAGWVWRSGADERTCAACFSLHGTFFPGSTPMRAHPNCRCVMIPKRKVKDDPYGFGNAVKVGNGKDLFDALPEAAQRRILGPGRLSLYKAGKVPFSGMRTLRNNPVWGPSYQVKSLRAIKEDLDKPPPAPKVPKPKAPPSLPSAPVVDEVLEAEQTALAAPKAVPVASKATAVQKAEVKVAAQEARLLEIAEAEKRFDASIPHVDIAEAARWRRGEVATDQHIIRFTSNVRSQAGDQYWGMGLDRDDAILAHYDYNAHFVPGVGNVMYRPLAREIENGARIEYTLIRTVRRVAGNYPVEDFTNPAFTAAVIRALPERTADMALILRRTAVEKALAEAKVALERIVNPGLHPVRAAAARQAPREVTLEEMKVAIDSYDVARMEQVFRDYSARYEYDYVRSIAGKNKPVGEIPIGVGGTTVPIPSTSAFTGKPRKWTTRFDPDPTRAKDTVAYQIAERLRNDDVFIRALAENDRLGEWIIGAGRATSENMRSIAGSWANLTPHLREQFLRSGSLDSGYYKWVVREKRDPLTFMPTGELEAVRGAYVRSTRTGGAEFVYDYTSSLVQQWAVTSGDSHVLSVALQRAAQEEFSLAATTTLDHFRGRQHSGGYGVDSGPLLEASEAFYTANGASLRRFVRSMYDHTQEELAWAGITSVKAIRGVGSIPTATEKFWRDQGMSVSAGTGAAGPVDLQPMSSFAVDATTARRFGGNLLYVDIPASWIVGTARTGFGCLNEFEWVVLGGPMEATVVPSYGFR